MTDQNVTNQGASLVNHRGVRCLLAALFVAGVTLAIVNVFAWVVPDKQAQVFFLILGVGFIAGQIQERMFRLKDKS